MRRSFAATTRFGLRGHSFRIYQQRCKTRRRVVQIARGDAERFICADIQEAPGSPMAVPLPRRPSLIRPPISPSEIVSTLSYPTPMLPWSSIVVFTAH